MYEDFVRQTRTDRRYKNWPNLIQRLESSWPCTRCTTPNLTWTGCTCPELKEVEGSYNRSFFSYKSTTIGLDKYLQETHDTLLHFVKDHDDRKSLYSISRQSVKFSRELGVPVIPPAEDEANTTYARRTKAKARHQGCQQLRSKWESKALHGKYPQRVKQTNVDQEKNHRWLKAAGLKAETEGFIIAPKIKASQHAGTNTTSSRSLTWTQNVDCMAVSTRPLTT